LRRQLLSPALREPGAAGKPREARREDHVDRLLRLRESRRCGRGQEPELLRGYAEPEADLEDRHVAHPRARCAPTRVRAPDRRLLRPSAAV